MPNLGKYDGFHGPYDLAAHFPNFYNLMLVAHDVHRFHICLSITWLAPIKVPH